MKHFNWDCECRDCMIMKAGPALYEALKFFVSRVSIMGQFTPEKQSELKRALAKVEK